MSVTAPIDCVYCAKALQAEWNGYFAHCRGCQARSIAESPQAYLAWGPDADVEPLKALVRNVVANGRRQMAEDARAWFELLQARRAKP